MSFYRDDENNNESQNKDYSYSPLQERLRQEEEHHRKRNQKKKGGNKIGYFFSGFAGAIVGALLVWLLLPSMVDQLPQGSVNRSDDTPRITQKATEVTTDVTQAVEKVSDAVVGITNIQEVSDFWTRQSKRTEAGSGSGVIYKIEGKKAYIVTNYHVVEKAKQLEVTLADGTKE